MEVQRPDEPSCLSDGLVGWTFGLLVCLLVDRSVKLSKKSLTLFHAFPHVICYRPVCCCQIQFLHNWPFPSVPHNPPPPSVTPSKWCTYFVKVYKVVKCRSCIKRVWRYKGSILLFYGLFVLVYLTQKSAEKVYLPFFLQADEKHSWNHSCSLFFSI